jgi:nucleotide-binding universal stress UspA family protein
MERGMYRSLLVPLDGSAFGEHALPFALSIARRAGATVNLVQVHVPFTLLYVDSLSPGSYEAEARMKVQEQNYLDEVVKRLATAASVPVTSALTSGQKTK